jgi:hypothetical protein
MTQEQLQSLLKERAKMQMPADYPQALLKQLHLRQREELLHRSLWRIAADRVSTYLGEYSVSTPVYLSSLAALFAIGLGAIFWIRPSGTLSLRKDDSVLAQRLTPIPATTTTAPSKSPGVLQIPVDTQQVSFGQQ